MITKRLQRSYTNRKNKGLTLAELLIALAIVPGLLLAASVIYIHIARSLQETTDRGQAITQREHVVNFLERYIANGNSVAALPIPTDPVAGCFNETPCDWAYALAVTMPDPGQYIIYRLKKTSDLPILEYCPATTHPGSCDGNVWQQITYSGTSDFGGNNIVHLNTGWIDRQTNGTNQPVPPFVWDLPTKTVKVNLLFHTFEKVNGQSYSIPVSFDVKLRGGTTT